VIGDSGGATLYHASYRPIERVDLAASKKRNDFGRGFYVTTSAEQAERFVRSALRKAGLTTGVGFVSEYSTVGFSGLDCLEFESTDEAWLGCVCAFRTLTVDVSTWETRDVIAGKIANDDTMTVINIYLAEGYGPVGSPDAVATAIRLLKPERLQDQLCLKTETALERVTFVRAQEVAVR
jgi:hypothetical protein